MKKIEVRKVKRGEHLRLTDSEDAPVWVRDSYNKFSKKFEVYKYDNICHFAELKGSRKVYID